MNINIKKYFLINISITLLVPIIISIIFWFFDNVFSIFSYCIYLLQWIIYFIFFKIELYNSFWELMYYILPFIIYYFIFTITHYFIYKYNKIIIWYMFSVLITLLNIFFWFLCIIFIFST